jgi:hypothetical protein
VLGTLISFVLVMFVRLDIWVLLIKAEWVSKEWLASLPTYAMSESGDLQMKLSYVWMWPLTAILTLVLGLVIPRGKGGGNIDEHGWHRPASQQS